MTTPAERPSIVPPRLSHALSTYAVGALAGQLAGAAWLLPLAVILNPEDSQAFVALVPLSPIAGLLYVELLWWLPHQLIWRMLVFGVVTATSVGVLAGVMLESAPTWTTMLLALAIGATMPPSTRFVVWAFVRSIASVMSLRPGQSLPVLFLVAVIIVSTSEPLIQVVRGSPALAGAVALCLVALGLAIWTVGLRPVDVRPRWFRAYGVVATSFLVTVGIVSSRT